MSMEPLPQIKYVMDYHAKGWFSGGAREDIPLQHVTSVRLEAALPSWLLPLVVLTISLLASCASVPLAAPDLDQAAKTFQPPPTQAHIYIVRTGAAARHILFHVLLDGTMAGSLAANTYLLARVSPGPHMLTSITSENQANLPLLVEAGQNYFVRLFPRFGWIDNRVGLEMMENAAGREAVSTTVRVEGMGVKER